MDKKIVEHFKKVDPKLHAYIHRVELATHRYVENLFAHICDEIISQQLSGKAAASIFEKFSKLFPDGQITPENVMKIADEKIRNAGTSWAKVRSLKDLADKVLKKEIHLDILDKLSDEEVVKELTKVKGIGPWTAEMFLMFTLGREDVFSFGDLGLKKGIQKLYGMKEMPTQKEMEKIIKKWSPYKTYASRILWKILELKD